MTRIKSIFCKSYKYLSFFQMLSQCIYIYKKDKECSKKQYFETNKFYGRPKIQKLQIIKKFTAE